MRNILLTMAALGLVSFAINRAARCMVTAAIEQSKKDTEAFSARCHDSAIQHIDVGDVGGVGTHYSYKSPE